MATLPAIDANDEPKSLAAFRFYCCALGSLGQLPVRLSGVLPSRPACVLRLCLLGETQYSAHLLLRTGVPWPAARGCWSLLMLGAAQLERSPAPRNTERDAAHRNLHPSCLPCQKEKQCLTFKSHPCLSHIIALQESPTPTLPLYSEEWVEELLSRVFAIITNLDSPEHRGKLDLGCRSWAV